MQDTEDEDLAAGWRPSPQPYEPRGPLTVAEHALFAFLVVGIIAGSAWLTLYTNGVGR